jgi:hypothetical protein
MLLLADGARLFEPARDAAIEFIFTMDRQVIAIASWIACRTSGISRVVAAWPAHPQISQIAQIIFLERRNPQSAIRNPRSAVLRRLTSVR